MPQILHSLSPSKRLIPIFGAVFIAQAVSGCVLNSKSQDSSLQGDGNFVTGSLGSNNSSLQESNKWAAKWQKNPSDAGIAINYARSLRTVGKHKTAVQVLQQASLSAPKNQAVIAEYGKALSTVGQLKQAMHNLNRAQTLGTPDWRIYSAQGITLDRMEQHSSARKHYKSALNLKPNHPSVLNNIGLSYALDGNLASAEDYLRRAAAASGSRPKVQQNLALVLGLNGKFDQSAKASNAVLSSGDTAINIAYMKNMLSQPGTWQKLASKTKVAASKPRKTKKRVASLPRKITTLEKKKSAPPAKKKITMVKKKKIASPAKKKVTMLEKKKISSPAKKKITTLEKSKKTDKLKVSAAKTLPITSKKTEQTATKPNPAARKKLSSFNNKMEKAIAGAQRTASADHLNLRTN